MNKLDGQLLVITQQEYRCWQGIIKLQGKKLDAYDYIIYRLGDIQKFKNLFDDPAAPISVKLRRGDTWDGLVDKIIKAQNKSVLTRK